MSPPDVPGYPGRPLPPKEPRRERQERRDLPPRRLSPPEMPAPSIPEPARVPVEAMPQASLFARLAPDRWARNVVWIVLSLGLVGSGSAVAINQVPPAPAPPPAPPVVPVDCASKAEFIQLRDLARQRFWRLDEFEDMVATAFQKGICSVVQVDGKKRVECVEVRLRGFVAQNATMIPKQLEPPVYEVELNNRNPTERPRN